MLGIYVWGSNKNGRLSSDISQERLDTPTNLPAWNDLNKETSISIAESQFLIARGIKLYELRIHMQMNKLFFMGLAFRSFRLQQK